MQQQHLFIMKGEWKWRQRASRESTKSYPLLTGGKILIVRAESVTIVRERRRSEEQSRTKLDAFFSSTSASRNCCYHIWEKTSSLYTHSRFVALALLSHLDRRTHTNNKKKIESDQVGEKRKKESLARVLVRWQNIGAPHCWVKKLFDRKAI
jgi:hypothetical protein